MLKAEVLAPPAVEDEAKLRADIAAAQARVQSTSAPPPRKDKPLTFWESVMHSLTVEEDEEGKSQGWVCCTAKRQPPGTYDYPIEASRGEV